MVQVGMGDENVPDILRGPSQAGNIFQGLRFAEWHPGIDDRQPVRFDDQVGIGLHIWDDVDVFGDLHFSNRMKTEL